MIKYIKHLVECQCVLSIFKNKSKPVYHKIQVFSELSDDDQIKEKYIICENCGIVHFVNEIAKSEIQWGKENLKSMVVTKEDIKFNLENQGLERLCNVLETNNLEVCDWEIAEFLYENNCSGIIVLNKNEIDNNIVTQFIEFNKGKFKIKKEISQRYI